MTVKQLCFILQLVLEKLGKSLAIAMIVAGRGKMELLDWENQDPQPVCYVDGEMLEEDIHERIKLLIPSLDVDEDLLRKTSGIYQESLN